MSRPAGGEWQRLHLLTWSGFQSSQLLEFSGRSGSGHLLVLRTLCPAQRGPAEWTKVGAEIHLAVGPAAEWLEEPGVREPHSNKHLIFKPSLPGRCLLYTVRRCYAY